MQVQLHTFLFADISSYSMLTELEGDEAAADLAIWFSDEVSRMAEAYGADVVRRIGDGVMVHCVNASGAIALGLRLVHSTRDSDGRGRALPAIHAGIHTGPALVRGGDWWGATVNVTARVAAAAEAGELLVTEPSTQAAGDLDGAQLSRRGAMRFKNVSAPVSVYSSLRRCGMGRRLLDSLSDLRLRAGRLLDDVPDRGFGREGFRPDAT